MLHLPHPISPCGPVFQGNPDSARTKPQRFFRFLITFSSLPFDACFVVFYFVSHCTLRMPRKTKEEEFKFPSNDAKPLNKFLSNDRDISMGLRLGK